MGLSSSRHGSPPPPTTPRRKRTTLKRTLSSVFICGSSSSTSLMEDDAAEYCHDPDNNSKCKRPTKEFALTSRTQYGFTRSKTETAPTPDGSVVVGDNTFAENGAGSSVTYSSHRASTSNEDKPTQDPSSSNERADVSSADGRNDLTESITQSISQSSQLLEDLLEVENGSNVREVTVFHNSYSGPVEDTSQETLATFPEFLDAERGQDDMVSTSSDTMSSATTETNSHELRRDSRRLFWDAFSRRISRRHSDSRTFVFSPDGSDDSGPHHRWHTDFADVTLDAGARGDTRFLGTQSHNVIERLRPSRSEVWDRIHGGTGHRRDGCPSGLHLDGACSCESMLTARDDGPRASISRIIMLAEALFEVLDEIHRQPVSPSLSMGSLPAPESVVDSLPMKIHTNKNNRGNDIEWCQICLAEYEEEDKLRVLPCQHEYHMSCVDKWLKEIHGVCPLCRRDVCGPEPSVSNLGTSSS